MELRHLHSFLALAEELHFGRAAERLGIAQPPLSRHIQQLETEIGVRLFERTPRTVRLTGAGEELRARIQSHVDGIAAAVASCRAAGSGRAGRLRAGFTGNLAFRLVPQVLQRLRQAAPHASFELREMSTDPQVDALREGKLDVGLVFLPVPDPSLIQRRLFQDPIVLAVPESHPLAEQESVAIAQLRDQPFIMYLSPQPTAYQQAILERCARLDFRPRVAQQVEGKTLMWELVAAGMGLSLVPATSADRQRPGVTYRPILDSIEPMDVAAVWRPDSDEPLRRLFVDTAVAVARHIYGRAPVLT